MNDDWRLQVDSHEEERVRSLLERLDARELEHDLSDAFHDRVIVSRDGNHLFLYAGSREQAEAAHKLIDELAAKHGWSIDAELKHWHPTAEEWEDPDVPLPDGDAAKAAVRRGRHLLVGAADEDQAKALAERIEAEVPADSDVRAEGTWKAAYAERPPNPFAIFGGLGG